MKFIIVTGSPVDGSAFTGPFETSEEAVEWAEANCNDEWWIATLTHPEEVY